MPFWNAQVSYCITSVLDVAPHDTQQELEGLISDVCQRFQIPSALTLSQVSCLKTLACKVWQEALGERLASTTHAVAAFTVMPGLPE